MRLTVRKRVVLPEPLRPSKTVMEPESTEKEMFSSSDRPCGAITDTERNSIAALMPLSVRQGVQPIGHAAARGDGPI